MSTTTTTTTTTTPFKSSLQLQTKKPTARAFASSLPSDNAVSVSNAAEARYWLEKFGLGRKSSSGTGTTPRFAHPRKLVLQAGSSAVVHQLVFGPVSSASASASTAAAAPLAVVCGPRVKLYGTTPQSPFHRRLMSMSSSRRHQENNDNDSVVQADRQVPTGGHLALTASYRNDGRLLAIGTHLGQVRIADATTRATLCTFVASALSIRATTWFRNGQDVLAAGDDGMLRVWRLSSAATSMTNNKAPLCTLSGHGDAIRCAVLWQQQQQQQQQDSSTGGVTSAKPAATAASWPYRNLAATGSYDHTVRLWNMDDLDLQQQGENIEMKDTDNNNRCLSVLVHGGPVETLLFQPSSNRHVPVWLLSAGGTTVKVWNPVTGTCVSTVNAKHRKTITSLLSMPKLNQDGMGTTTTTTTTTPSMRILTGGLDGLIRIHAWDSQSGTLQFVHGIKLGSGGGSGGGGETGSADVAITALAASGSGDRLVIGTASGTVLVRQKGPSWTARKRKREPRAGTYAFFTRGMNADAMAGDFVVGAAAPNKKRKLRKFDLALKQFRYGDALDEALETRIPQAVVAVLEELGKRRGLTIALSNRDEESLEPILSFTVRYICRPRFASLLIGVANKLIDIYGDVAGQSETIDELFDKLKNQVAAETRVQKNLLLRLVGQLDAIMASVATQEEDENS